MKVYLEQKVHTSINNTTNWKREKGAIKKEIKNKKSKTKFQMPKLAEIFWMGNLMNSQVKIRESFVKNLF